jgi:tRNA nucleotidyltransferase (CCA-adding enzyme)
MVMRKVVIAESPAYAVRKLLDAGHEAGVVGGCVRDALLGLEPRDWDICTSAEPHEIIEVFSGFRVIETGLKHGTVTVVINSENIEISTFRYDKNLIEDLRRRDFTMNAIYYSDAAGIVDPFNGTADIEARVIRCVEDADARFREDPLRILRAVRFASALGFTVESSTRESMLRNTPLLSSVSAERISSELMKMLSGKNCGIIGGFADIITFVIPEMKAEVGFAQNSEYHPYDVWSHTVLAVCSADEPAVRLAMFFHDIGKPQCYTAGDDGAGHFYGHAEVSARMVEEVFSRLRFTAAEGMDKGLLRDVSELIKLHDIDVEPTRSSVRRMLSKLGSRQEQFKRYLAVRRADVMAQAIDKAAPRLEKIALLEKLLEEVAAEKACLTVKDLAVNGDDIIRAGIKPGAAVGFILRRLLDMVIEDPGINTREILLGKIPGMKYPPE